MKPELKRNLLSLIFIATVLSATGCGDAEKREVKSLRVSIDALISKNQSVILEKAKTEAEAEIKIKELKSEAAQLRNALAKAEQRVLEVEENARATLSAASAKYQTAARQGAELMAEITNLRQEANSKKGVLSGVVTYFFNKNFGYKPDIGSEVLIVPKSAYIDFDFSVIEKFQNVRSLYALEEVEKENAILAAKLGVKFMLLPRVERYGIKSQNDWEALSEEANRVWQIAVQGKSSIRLIVDANGSFKRSLTAGEYYVLIRSKQRSGMNSLDLLGKVYAEKILVMSDEEVSVSAKFEVF